MGFGSLELSQISKIMSVGMRLLIWFVKKLLQNSFLLFFLIAEKTKRDAIISRHSGSTAGVLIYNSLINTSDIYNLQ